MTDLLNTLEKLANEAKATPDYFWHDREDVRKYHAALNPTTTLKLISVIRTMEKALGYIEEWGCGVGSCKDQNCISGTTARKALESVKEMLK